jgi:hypothetical protein
VYHPTTAVTDASSASTKRLKYRDSARGDIGRPSHEMLTVPSTTHTPVCGRRPVPRHDGQRPARSTADALEDLDELWVRANDLSRPVITELPAAEMRAEISHALSWS